MSGNIYDHPSDTMMANARKWLDLALHDDREFERHLKTVMTTEAISFDDAMTLAHAALMVSDNCTSQSFGPWYRECASVLFRRAYDAIAVEREARAAVEAGQVQ